MTRKSFRKLFPLLCGPLLLSGCTFFNPAPVPECTTCMAVTIAPPPGDRSLRGDENLSTAPSRKFRNNGKVGF